VKGTYNLPAPGKLETVRQFMNTWLVPSATQVPEDRLPAVMQHQETWCQQFPHVPLGTSDSVELLTTLRDDLRSMLDGRAWPDRLQPWLERFPPVVDVVITAAGTTVRHAASPHAGVAGWMLAAVVDAMADDTWTRLKRCPDCQWIFYDRSRNRSKIWCDMLSGGAGGRSCGTIAKVNRYRQRQPSER
jgi:predicted RNA-binding Zn ribbon-like protein